MSDVKEKNLGGRPAYYENPADLQIEAEKFFAECEDKGKNPTITGLCYSLGFESRQSFYDMETRDGFSYIIKRLRLCVESGYETRLGEGACAGAIFALKNMGWKDKTEHEMSGGIDMGKKPSWFDTGNNEAPYVHPTDRTA